LGAQLTQPVVNILVSPVDLFDILDNTPAFRAKGGNQQGYAGPDIGAAHTDPPEALLPRHTDHGGPVRVAENNLGSHIDQLVYKKQPAFEHFLMDKDRSTGLCGHYQHDA
jgi:hypothetical protein